MNDEWMHSYVLADKSICVWIRSVLFCTVLLIPFHVFVIYIQLIDFSAIILYNKEVNTTFFTLETALNLILCWGRYDNIFKNVKHAYSFIYTFENIYYEYYRHLVMLPKFNLWAIFEMVNSTTWLLIKNRKKKRLYNHFFLHYYFSIDSQKKNETIKINSLIQMRKRVFYVYNFFLTFYLIKTS